MIRNFEQLKIILSSYQIPEKYLGKKPVVGSDDNKSIFGSALKYLSGNVALGGIFTAKKTEMPLDLLNFIMEDKKEVSFYELLSKYIDRSKYKKDSDVYNKAGMSRAMFSKIRSGHIPKRTSVLRIAFVLELTCAETKRLLNSAGYEFLANNKFDKFIMYFLNEAANGRKYDYDILNTWCYSLTGIPLYGEK